MRLAGFLNHDNQFMVMCVSGEQPQVLRWDAVGEEELVGRFFFGQRWLQECDVLSSGTRMELYVLDNR